MIQTPESPALASHPTHSSSSDEVLSQTATAPTSSPSQALESIATEHSTSPQEATSAQQGLSESASVESAEVPSAHAAESPVNPRPAAQSERDQNANEEEAHEENANEEEAHAGADGPSSNAEGSAEENGPQGPALEGGKKKRRRRKKKGGGAIAEGPEGPPLQASSPPAAALKPTSERLPRKDRDRGHHTPQTRERAAFQMGEEVFGKVTSVLEHAIMVDLAGKALAIFDRSEFAPDDLIPSVSDRFVAQVHSDGGRGGLVVLTRKPLREEETKPKVEQSFREKTTVMGLVTGVIRGGLEVDVEGLRAFAPASHMDLRPGADLIHFIAQRLPFYVEQYAKRGRDVVLSRRAILEEEAKKQRDESLAKVTVGSVVKGIARSIVQWGVFVALPDVDNIEGLVHLSEVSHDPRAKLHDIVKVGAEIQVKVLKVDDKGKLWLSKKAAEPDPWEELRIKYAVGTRHKGPVTRIQPFGVFVELEPGLDGLIPMPDLSIKRIERPEDLVKEGQEIEVVVVSLDATARKVTLHPAPPPNEADIKQRVMPHKPLKVVVVSTESSGLIVRIMGMTGRTARGFIPAGHTGTPKGADLRRHFPVGAQIEAKVIEAEPRRGEVKLSIRALREDTEKAAYHEYRVGVAKEAKFGTFGDLLKKAQKPSL